MSNLGLKKFLQLDVRFQSYGHKKDIYVRSHAIIQRIFSRHVICLNMSKFCKEFESEVIFTF